MIPWKTQRRRDAEIAEDEKLTFSAVPNLKMYEASGTLLTANEREQTLMSRLIAHTPLVAIRGFYGCASAPLHCYLEE